MFTLKHLSPTGAEGLYEADEVFFQPDESAGLAQPSGTAAHSLGIVSYKEAGGSTLQGLTGGYVYVMNEAGSTVAKYDLGLWGTGRAARIAADYRPQTTTGMSENGVG